MFDLVAGTHVADDLVAGTDDLVAGTYDLVAGTDDLVAGTHVADASPALSPLAQRGGQRGQVRERAGLLLLSLLSLVRRSGRSGQRESRTPPALSPLALTSLSSSRCLCGLRSHLSVG